MSHLKHGRGRKPHLGEKNRTFVISRSKHQSLPFQNLVLDFRRCMEPWTASKLKVQKWNKFKDFLKASGPLGYSHILSFSTTDIGTYLHIYKLPRGPTLSFKIDRYTTSSDIKKYQVRPKNVNSTAYTVPPLLIIHGVPDDQKHLVLTKTIWQSLFPPNNMETMKLTECRRVMLLSYSAKDDSFYFRHYMLDLRPAAMSAVTKNILRSNIPNLSQFNDIADYFFHTAREGISQGLIHPSDYTDLETESEIEHDTENDTDTQIKELPSIDQGNTDSLDDFGLSDEEEEEDSSLDSFVDKTPIVIHSQPVAGKQNKLTNKKLVKQIPRLAPRKRMRVERKIKRKIRSGAGYTGVTEKSFITLVETGPRLKMQLFQIQSEIHSGKILYSLNPKPEGEKPKKKVKSKTRRYSNKEGNPKAKVSKVKSFEPSPSSVNSKRGSGSSSGSKSGSVKLKSRTKYHK